MILNKKYKFMILSLMFIFLICLNVASASSNETTQLELSDDSDIESVDLDEVVISENTSDVSSDSVVFENPDANKSTVFKESELKVESEFTRVANDYFAGERGGYFYGYLTDGNGTPLANKTVQIAINGPIYNVTTDGEGRAGLQVNIAYENIYTYALSFSGDDHYKASHLASSKLTVTKKHTEITASAKTTFKKSAKTKSFTAVLKTSPNPYDGKTYLKSGKKITLKVNGKTYTAKINSKGVAKFNVKLTKKGTYTAKIVYAGDRTYEACSKSVKIIIK